MISSLPGAGLAAYSAASSPDERDAVHFGSSVIHYRVLRSRRRKKTIEITLDPLDGVLVAAPMVADPGRIREIVARRAAWIVGRLSSHSLTPRRKDLVSGEAVPYLGRQVRLFVTGEDVRRATVQFDHWSLRLRVPAELRDETRREAVRQALTRWYRTRALERLVERVFRWAAEIATPPPPVMVRDQRQRWASCGPDGTLRFNWRIVMAPPTLIDYVVAHELVHLRVRTHAPSFWQELGRHMPDYALRRARLKEIGAGLSF